MMNKNYRGPYYLHRAAQRVDNREQQLEFSKKAMVGSRTRAGHGHPRGKRKPSARKKRKKLCTDHQHGQYYEHCKKSTKLRDSKAKW